MKPTLVQVPGLKRKVPMRLGVGEHAEIGTVSAAHVALVERMTGIHREWLWCDACAGYHLVDGQVTVDGLGTVDSVASQGQPSKGAPKAPPKVLRL